ncbi:MAG: class I SAM-dependent methyltransferase [Candidatus Blackburnbacteria bacterium]|nr:class I SAM-dependent methyltransferase [Candidatus Blackburnbacteria bacterium]
MAILKKLFPFLRNDERREIWVCQKLASIPKREKILDVGAGECRYKKYCQHLLYKSQDFGQYTGQGDYSGLQTGTWDTSKIDIISDITNIPVSSSSYDNILCTEVLEHIPYPDMAIKEISRILKKGGRLILTAPFCSLTHMSPYFYCTGFSISWYNRILKENKLDIVEMEANGNFFDFVSQELARLPLTLKKYSFLGLLALILYMLLLPIILLVSLLSYLDKGSEKQLCFGWHVLAKKC